MAMMSDSEVRSLATTLENYETREKKRELEKRQEKKENYRKWMELLYTGAGVAGAAGIGFMHGRFDDDDGNFFIPRTTLPADVTIGTLVGFGMGYIGTKRRRCSSQSRRSWRAAVMARPTHPGPPSAARAPSRALRISSAPRLHRDRRERRDDGRRSDQIACK